MMSLSCSQTELMTVLASPRLLLDCWLSWEWIRDWCRFVYLLYNSTVVCTVLTVHSFQDSVPNVVDQLLQLEARVLQQYCTVACTNSTFLQPFEFGVTEVDAWMRQTADGLLAVQGVDQGLVQVCVLVVQQYCSVYCTNCTLFRIPSPMLWTSCFRWR